MFDAFSSIMKIYMFAILFLFPIVTYVGCSMTTGRGVSMKAVHRDSSG